MGKAQYTRQAITIRFDENDAELTYWLGQFAQNQTMTKVVKLACYLLSGIQPEEGLLALLPEVQNELEPPTIVEEPPTPSPREDTNDALAAVMQELAALREELIQQRDAQPHQPASDHQAARPPSPPDTLPEEVPSGRGFVAASGLDMGGPRRKRTHPLEPVPRSQPTEAPLDSEECRRKLLDSIYAFSKESQRGQ